MVGKFAYVSPNVCVNTGLKVPRGNYNVQRFQVVVSWPGWSLEIRNKSTMNISGTSDTSSAWFVGSLHRQSVAPCAVRPICARPGARNVWRPRWVDCQPWKMSADVFGTDFANVNWPTLIGNRYSAHFSNFKLRFYVGKVKSIVRISCKRLISDSSCYCTPLTTKKEISRPLSPPPPPDYKKGNRRPGLLF